MDFESDRAALLRSFHQVAESCAAGKALAEAPLDPDLARSQFTRAIATMLSRAKVANMLVTELTDSVREVSERTYTGPGSVPELDKTKDTAEKVSAAMLDIRSQVDLMRHAGLAECSGHNEAGDLFKILHGGALAEDALDLKALQFLMDAVGEKFAEHLAAWLVSNAPKLIAQSVADAFQTTPWIQKNVAKYSPMRALPWESLAARAVRSEDGRALPRYVADLYVREVYKAVANAKDKVAEAEVPTREVAPPRSMATSAALLEIAQARFDIHTFAPTGTDEDYYRVGVGSLADALSDAYDLGLGRSCMARMTDQERRTDPLLVALAEGAGVPVLERRGDETLDFHEMSVWKLENLLEAARAAGAQARRGATFGAR